MAELLTPEFPYEVRVSKRARRVNLSIRSGAKLEVVIPQRFDRSLIPRILQDNRAWIEKTLRKWKAQEASNTEQWPPTQIVLSGIGRTLGLHYISIPGASSVVGHLRGDCLTLQGDPSQQDAYVSVFEKHLKEIARHALGERLQSLSKVHGLGYGKLSIRGQKTRWGSCSSRKNISLNYKLLFLPPELIDYVLLHELAHTVHLNHSPAFWALLESLLPAARELDKSIRRASDCLPSWV